MSLLAIRKRFKAISQAIFQALLWLGRVHCLLYLVSYIIVIFAFSGIYCFLPGRPFYHSTAQYEFDQFTNDANKILSEINGCIRTNLIQHYNSDQLQIRGWNLNINAMEVSSLLVRNFPEEFSFRVIAPITRIDPRGKSWTQLRATVTAQLNGKIIIGDTVYLFIKPSDSKQFKTSGIPAEPGLIDILPGPKDHISLSGQVVGLPIPLYSDIIGFGQGYRGFPAKVQGHYFRMLYFSAGVATSSALGDILPVTTTARVLVTVEALASLLIVGLFLNALGVSIAGGAGGQKPGASSTLPST